MTMPIDNTQPPNTSFATIIKTVLCAFIGIRIGRDSATGDSRLNPVHVIIAGLVGVGIFIAVLICVVKAVVAQ